MAGYERPTFLNLFLSFCLFGLLGEARSGGTRREGEKLTRAHRLNAIVHQSIGRNAYPPFAGCDPKVQKQAEKGNEDPWSKTGPLVRSSLQ